MLQSRNSVIKILSNIFFLLMICLIIFNILFIYINNYNIAENFMIYKIYNYISILIVPITIFTIIIGGILFNQDKNKVTLEDIKEEENIKSNIKIKKFNEYLGFLNIPFLKTKSNISIILSLLFLPFNLVLRLVYLILKFLCTEGWGYILVLILIFFLGLYLRLYNLDTLSPYTDEWVYLISAKDRIVGLGHDYNRSLFIIDVVHYFFTNFDISLYRGRFPSAIIGSLTIFPLYFLSKTINKKLAILVVFLLAIYPWAIGVSQTIREYAYFPFFILLLIVFYTKILDYFLGKNFSWKKANTYIYAVLGVIPFYYGFIYNSFSTFKIFIIFLGGILIHKLFFEYRSKFFLLIRKRFFIYVIFLFLFLGIYLTLNSKQVSFDLLRNNNINYFRVFLFSKISAPMHLYWENPNILVIPFLLILAIIISFYKKDSKLTIFSIIFLILILFYVVFFDRYFKPRYIYYVLPIFLILISYSILYLFSIEKSFKYRFLLFLFFITFFSPINTITAILWEKHGYVNTTYEYHDNIESTLSFIKNKHQEDYIYICTVFGSALSFYMDVDQEKIYSYDRTDPERFNILEKIIKENKKGLIILDWRRNGYRSKGLPKKNFELGGKQIKIISNKDGFQVYEW